MTRLSSLSSQLAERLRQSTPVKQRAAATAAIRFALRNASSKHAAIEDALSAVELGRTLSDPQRLVLSALVAALDEDYFRLHVAAEEGGTSADDYLRAFAKARAANAVLHAGGVDPLEASSQAIYEAAATTDDWSELQQIIEAILK